jgi:hypothetical protein
MHGFEEIGGKKRTEELMSVNADLANPSGRAV